MKKNILVTGGAGFIGSNLVEKLLNEGAWRISVIDNFNNFYSPAIKKKNIESFLENPDFQLYEEDICNAAGVEKIFRGGEFEIVVHLAARAGVRPSLEEPILYADTNVVGTVNLLEAARKFDVRQFLFGSSSSVYGELSESPFVETANISAPISPYAATKISGEAICHTYSHLYDLRTICLRFFTVYGARQRPDLAIHKFSRLIMENSPIPVFGDGLTRRDYTYIDDILQGVRAAIDYKDSAFEAINLGESQTVELRELVNLLEKHLGKKAIINQQPMQPGDVPLTYADISKAKRLLNYQPITKIDEGIGKFTDWFRESNGYSTI